METKTLDRIGTLLAGLGGPAAFASKRTAPAADMHLEVEGVGPIRLPVSRAQAERLCRVARPARYGQGERTLLDHGVRDTWEVPKSRVKVDQRRWNRTLRPMLERVRADLGLPDDDGLRAEFHSMLVYGPGQFFRTHQDSEKSDDMVATLVVTLPSSFKGGSLVIQHRGKTVTSRGSKSRLSFVAFYADCPHELRPVTAGYRVSLTYNLMLEGAGAGTPPGAESQIVDAATIATLADLLKEHLTTPVRPRYLRPGEDPLGEPPDRLVFLLDHQYTERGLAWHRLKGEDGARATALRAAAERADCEGALALAEIHEVRECWVDDRGWDAGWHGGGSGRRWERGEDDEWYEDEPPPLDDPDDYPLGDLMDWSVTLDRWIAPSGRNPEAIHTSASCEEVCYATATKDLEPYASEYEGYMGNYGNTMDRWYRRAAVVLWARERAFAIRAEASPSWALGTLRERIRAEAVSEAREMARSLLPFWRGAAWRQGWRLFGEVMVVAEALDEPELATALLEPFPLEGLTPSDAPALVALVERYGEVWLRSLLSTWSARARHWVGSLGLDGVTWLATLPRVAAALCEADVEKGSLTAGMLLEDRWVWLRGRIAETRPLRPPSRREGALEALGDPVLALLEAGAEAGAREVLDQAVRFLLRDGNEPLLPCLMHVLRGAATMEAMTPEAWKASGLGTLQAHCASLLKTRLATPARAADDWSLDPPGDCPCELCTTLADFLAASDRTRFEWPLAKQRRKHVHQALDRHELPVRHETRRSGRPYTLVLTKTEEIFEREVARRRRWRSDLEWLEETGGVRAK